MVVVNGRMYVTSSADDSETQQASTIEVYDPIDDTWRGYTSNLGWEPTNSTISLCHQGYSLRHDLTP